MFASEIRDDLRTLYALNHHVYGPIAGDITKVDYSQIPTHDVLCAGFPCQPFSQAGKRQGFSDKEGRGNLFRCICDIIIAQKTEKPKYIFLENVANLKGHDRGNTWQTIKKKLTILGYEVDEKILSPHQFGIPQHRKRIYIVGVRKDKGGLTDFTFPVPKPFPVCDIHKIIDEKDTEIVPLRLDTLSQLKVWQAFIRNCMKHNGGMPRFPIWAMEFGANYPYKDKAPAYLDKDSLIGKRGKLGIKINGENLQDCIKQLPIYAQAKTAEVFPQWKIRYISQNRDFYEKNRKWIDKWLKKIEKYKNSHMKLEWNCGNTEEVELNTNIVQFRASGIRVKLPTFSPALNLCGTQIPILPWIRLPDSCIPEYTKKELKHYGLSKEDVKYGRYLSIKESARLQGMEGLCFSNLTQSRIYEALGNAVNTQVVEFIARNLIKTK